MPIDVHAHFYAPQYSAFLRRHGGASIQLADNVALQGKRSRYMSGAMEERIDFLSSRSIKQILCVPGQSVLVSDVQECRDNSVASNDALAEVCQRKPDLFSFFATLPLVDGEAAVQELERSVQDHGALGTTFPTHVLGRRLDWDGLEPVYAALERMKLPLLLHPLPPPHKVAPEGHTDCGLTGTLYFPVEDTHALLRLIGCGVLERYPGLRVICPHLGGLLPFFFFRVAGGLKPELPGGGDLPRPSLSYLNQVLFDTVSMHPPAVRCACDTFGPDHLVFGTDLPYEEEPQIQINLSIVANLGLSAAEQEGILERNIMRWLPDDAFRDLRASLEHAAEV